MFNSSTHKNLRLLWWMRTIAIIGQASAVLIVTAALNIPLHTIALWIIIGTLAITNSLTWWRIQTAVFISKNEFFAQLLIDMSALFGLLYFTGGASNPFASLFILQVIIAAITLTPIYTWITAGITIAFYSALLFWRIDVPYFHHHPTGDFFNLHIEGMLISFVLLAIIVAWFVVRMNITIRRQDALLAEAEKIAAIGALAAHAAHELGTPLATLSILAENAGDLSPIFKEQLMRCKGIISRITAAGGVMRAQGGAPMLLDTFIHDIIARWKEDNPQIHFTNSVTFNTAPRILAEHGLEQAIRNLLDNAADASPHAVSLHAKWSTNTLTIAIEDKGVGMPQEIIDAIGKGVATTKVGGMGMGLLLAQSVIARLEGILTIDSSLQGTIATISLPLKKLIV